MKVVSFEPRRWRSMLRVRLAHPLEFNAALSSSHTLIVLQANMIPTVARILRAGGVSRPARSLVAFKSSVVASVEEPTLDDKHFDFEPLAEPVSSTLLSTYDHNKSGTPSPWAVFDAWGAGADEHLHKDPLTPDEMALLDVDSVKIPITETQRATLPDEADILKAYDHLLQTKSSVHFGYPYNLAFDFTELSPFLRYSINNLGDPFVPSNYGVHSRQFEVSVIDFFAQMWKMEAGTYWGYGTCIGVETLTSCCLAASLFLLTFRSFFDPPLPYASYYPYLSHY
jgi:hypothetical protein